MYIYTYTHEHTRRLIRIASEDVGLADPSALPQVCLQTNTFSAYVYIPVYACRCQYMYTIEDKGLADPSALPQFYLHTNPISSYIYIYMYVSIYLHMCVYK